MFWINYRYRCGNFVNSVTATHGYTGNHLVSIKYHCTTDNALSLFENLAGVSHGHLVYVFLLTFTLQFHLLVVWSGICCFWVDLIVYLWKRRLRTRIIFFYKITHNLVAIYPSNLLFPIDSRTRHHNPHSIQHIRCNKDLYY